MPPERMGFNVKESYDEPRIDVLKEAYIYPDPQSMEEIKELPHKLVQRYAR